MEYILYSLCIFLLFEFCGIGLTFLLCPRILEKYSIFFAPYVGLTLFSIIGMYFADFTPFGSNKYAPCVILISGLFLLCSIFNKKERLKELLWPFQKENIYLIIFCIILYICISVPFFFKFNGLTTITFSNNDLAHYAAVSKFLTQSSFINPPLSVDSVFVNWVAQKAAHFGAYFATAIPSSLLCIEIYKIQNIVLNLFYVFTLPLVYIFSLEIFKYKKHVAFLPVILVGISAHLLYINYNGFIGQILGLGLFLSLVFVTIHLFLNEDSDIDILHYYLFSTILTLGLILCYSPMLIIYYIPLIIFFTIISIFERKYNYLLKSIFYFGLTFIAAFIISPFAVKQIISDMLFYDQVFGWTMPFLFPERVFGLTGNNLGEQLNIIPEFIISIPICILVILSLISLYKNEKKAFFLSISYICCFSLLYCYLEYKEYLSAGFTGESYKAYKLFTYCLPIIILSGLAYFKNFDLKINKQINFHRSIAYLFLILLLIGNIWSAVAISYGNYKYCKGVDENIIDLDKISSITNISSLNILTPPYWDQMWIYYVLFMNKKLYLEYTSSYLASNLSGEWTLHDKNPSDIISTDINDPIKIFLNNRYYLTQKRFEASIGKGWYVPEKNNYGRWFGADNNSATIYINSTYDFMFFDLDLTYNAINPDNSFLVTLDDKNITNCVNKTFCHVNDIPISKGEHEIIFKPKFEAEKIKTDSRLLVYRFTNISFYGKMNNT